jgi:hypothetical protein
MYSGTPGISIESIYLLIHLSIHAHTHTHTQTVYGYMYTSRMHTVLKLKFWVCIYRVMIQVPGIYIARYNSSFAYIYTGRMYKSCKFKNSVYIKAVKSRAFVYKRQFQRFFGAYSLTKTHAMAVVGRQNMRGVPV